MLQEEQDALEQAAKCEEAAGVRCGPAEQELHRFRALNEALLEVRDGPFQYPYKSSCPITRCYYCEGPTAIDGGLCHSCQELFKAFVDGKMSDEEFAEQDRYRRIVTPYARGEHLVRNETGFIIGTKEPEGGTWVFTRHGKAEEVAPPTQR